MCALIVVARCAVAFLHLTTVFSGTTSSSTCFGCSAVLGSQVVCGVFAGVSVLNTQLQYISCPLVGIFSLDSYLPIIQLTHLHTFRWKRLVSKVTPCHLAGPDGAMYLPHGCDLVVCLAPPKCCLPRHHFHAVVSTAPSPKVGVCGFGVSSAVRSAARWRTAGSLIILV